MGSVEHVSGGGEIRLNRDKSVPAKTGDPRLGAFTLESVQEFALEAEVAGVAPTETLWFRYMPDYHDGTKVECMYFPTAGHIDYRPPSSQRPSDEGFSIYQVFAAACVAFVLGAFIGMVIFGG